MIFLKHAFLRKVGRSTRAQARQLMADHEAYKSAMAHAELLWPKTMSAPRAQSSGLPCSVHQLTRSRGDWTVMTPWEELLKSAVVWKQVRLFIEIDLVKTEHSRKTEDIVVLRQHLIEIFTFRPSDLHAATLSFVWAPLGADLFPCMLLDVLPRLADAHAEAFSYVIMFQHEGHARLVENRLNGSWYKARPPLPCADASAGDQSIDVASFLSNDAEDDADEAYAPGWTSTSNLALDARGAHACSAGSACRGNTTYTVILSDDDFALDTNCPEWQESLSWNELD